MSNSQNFQEQFSDSTERYRDPLKFDVEQVGETNVEVGEIPPNMSECISLAKRFSAEAVEERYIFLEEAA